ncbi:tripartite tricarboxylate transporter permease [Hoeflea poritis]|uniref:Tripartite tricarboxylate transporter permease n=1 Tax=Hoeflea poritis TaxID=2993659 RepID=A0ABT4VVG2_9HYPH|nr:tripartite tricarboxylate transporter permease [Hoeflea poritis]MDA4848712.1 tripartite tricarboxylate transporter permease [Hoeflea poritis]
MSQFAETTLQLIQPAALMWSLIGVALGLVVGAIPGLGGGLLMAMILPLTFSMESLDAQILLVGIYVGGVSGSMVSAILLGVPGAPAAVMTTLDGHAMARKGQAARAMSLGIMGSAIGGLIAGAILIVLAIPLASVALKFRNFDYFSFVVIGLVLIAFTGGNSPRLGLIAGLFGVFISTVGFDSVGAVNRFTYGSPMLANGFGLLPVLIGAYAVRQVLEDIQSPKGAGGKIETLPNVSAVLRHAGTIIAFPFTLIRSAVIGTFVGILPGVGPNVGAIMSYSAAQSLSKRKDEFGGGSEDAVVAAETGNNATVGGALVPMLALGIPGSGQDVFLMAALILHAIEPGPLLAIYHPEIFYGVMGTYLIANILMMILMIFAISWFARVIRIPHNVLLPVVLAFCVIGVVASSNRLEDAWIMLGFGLIGVAMAWGDIPVAPFVIGFILGPMAEERLRSSLMGTQGEILPLFGHPIAVSVLILCLVVISVAIFRNMQTSPKDRSR